MRTELSSAVPRAVVAGIKIDVDAAGVGATMRILEWPVVFRVDLANGWLS